MQTCMSGIQLDIRYRSEYLLEKVMRTSIQQTRWVFVSDLRLKWKRGPRRIEGGLNEKLHKLLNLNVQCLCVLWFGFWCLNVWSIQLKMVTQKYNDSSMKWIPLHQHTCLAEKLARGTTLCLCEHSWKRFWLKYLRRFLSIRRRQWCSFGNSFEPSYYPWLKLYNYLYSQNVWLFLVDEMCWNHVCYRVDNHNYRFEDFTQQSLHWNCIVDGHSFRLTDIL